MALWRMLGVSEGIRTKQMRALKGPIQESSDSKDKYTLSSSHGAGSSVDFQVSLFHFAVF